MFLRQKILFNKEECNTILNLVKNNQQNWKFKDRKYSSFTINSKKDTDWLFDKLKNYFTEETGIQLVKLKEEIHFHLFQKNDFFKKHNDTRDNRLYAIGVLLNDNFEGGDFNLYNPNELTLNKIIGNTYIFDVRIEHEITPILKGIRYSLLWFLQNENIKIKKNNLI